MVNLKQTLLSESHITQALCSEGQTCIEEYQDICHDVKVFKGILEQVQAVGDTSDIHAYMQNLKLVIDRMNNDIRTISLNYLFSLLSASREDLRIHAAFLLGEVVAKIPNAIERGRAHRYYFSRFFSTEVGEHTPLTKRRQQSMTYYLDGWQKTNQHLTMLVDEVLNILNNACNQQGDVVSICQALRDIVNLPMNASHQIKVRTLLDELIKHTASDHIINIAYTRSLYNLPIDFLLEIDSDKEHQIVYDYLVNGYSDALFTELDTSSIYLSNLKTATSSVLKKLHIKLLINGLRYHPSTAFYAAMHFSNLLKISTDYRVRTLAGEALVNSFNYLSAGEKNDIVVELIKSLDIENYQFTRFIPQYLGTLIATLSVNSIDEIINDFVIIIKTSKGARVKLLLDTVGVVAINLTREDREDVLERVVKLLLVGASHFVPIIRKHALKVITSLIRKVAYPYTMIYQQLAKKLLVYIITHEASGIMQLYMMPLKYELYAFINKVNNEGLKIDLRTPKKVAFFPGSFDPFSLAHLQSATQIRDMGYEVYLAIDEFSWSKRTQPNNIRREIVELAIAAERDIYVYPKSEIVNIANCEDLKGLRQNFAPREVYLVMGSDVLTGASAYRKDGIKEVILSFSHLLFSRAQGMGNSRDEQKIREVMDQIKGDVVVLDLPKTTQTISSTQIRTFIDQNRGIENLVDPLVELYINEKLLYRSEPQYKETMRAHATTVEVVEGLSQSIINKLSKAFPEAADQLSQLVKHTKLGADYRLLMIRRIDNSDVLGFSVFHWLKSSMIYQLFGSEDTSEYIREHAGGRITAIRLMYSKSQTMLKKIEQVILTETLAYNLAKDYHYAVFYPLDNSPSNALVSALKYQGFKLLPVDGCTAYTVDMHRPITINFDIKGMLKAPIRDAILVDAAIDKARKRIQLALTQFYPGELVLAIDRTMIYEHLLKNICDVNSVSTVESEQRRLGENMLVTYGDLFKRWRIPNTVTKALHTERFYDTTMSNYNILNHPNYLPLETQISTIRSFNRPVILLDDLLDNGKRFKLIASKLSDKDTKIKALVVAILTGRGKALMESQNTEVVSAYYLPNIRLWFNESMLYPFIGGDAVFAAPSEKIGAFYAINQIMPYVTPNYTKIFESKQIFEAFSLACLQSALDIMLALEQVYFELNNKNLSLYNIGDVFISPRLPYLDAERQYELSKKPSDYIKADIALLKRIMTT